MWTAVDVTITLYRVLLDKQYIFLISGIKCPVCSKFIPPDDIECHLVVCLTKPRITYNGKSW